MGIGLHFFYCGTSLFYCGTSLFTVVLHFLLLYFTFLPLDFTLKNFKKPLDFTAESVLLNINSMGPSKPQSLRA